MRCPYGHPIIGEPGAPCWRCLVLLLRDLWRAAVRWCRQVPRRPPANQQP